jgi:hypothetical protein
VFVFSGDRGYAGGIVKSCPLPSILTNQGFSPLRSMTRAFGMSGHSSVLSVTSWLLDPRPLPYAQEARRVIGERLRILSFVTVTEMRYGALRGATSGMG